MRSQTLARTRHTTFASCKSSILVTEAKLTHHINIFLIHTCLRSTSGQGPPKHPGAKGRCQEAGGHPPLLHRAFDTCYGAYKDKPTPV